MKIIKVSFYNTKHAILVLLIFSAMWYLEDKLESKVTPKSLKESNLCKWCSLTPSVNNTYGEHLYSICLPYETVTHLLIFRFKFHFSIHNCNLVIAFCKSILSAADLICENNFASSAYRKICARLLQICGKSLIKIMNSKGPRILPVSYTHLTLPTNREV